MPGKYLSVLIFNFLLIHGFSQEPDIKNLYYCNENESIAKILILNEENFLGWVFNNKINFLVLYNKERLAVDTLLLGDSRSYFLQHIWPVSENQFYVHLLGKMGLCSINENRFSACEFWTNTVGMPYNVLFKSDRLTIYVDVNYAANNKEKWKNHFIIERNGEFKNLTKRLIDYSYAHRPEKTIFEFYISAKQTKEIILPVEWANSIIFIKPMSGDYEIKTIPYSPGHEVSALYYYFDYVKNKHFFLVQKRKTKDYELFAIVDDFSEATFVSKLDFIPNYIRDGKALKTQIVQKKGKEYVCYYLITI